MYQARHLNSISDNFSSLAEVSEAIREAGLEKSQLIFGKSSKLLHRLVRRVIFASHLNRKRN
jgi:hypothetical protein